ncbi:LysE family translocator [Sphingomonas sanguinis]|uniref:Lysine transporter LysE n=1 Tax=Sphingomonas sanguinis TaxID=33051 RepID=A0A147JCX6_9SPHN|nr:LysE family translocator [Sphingomonas sanguinis]KTW17810.1 lysine transporter LysE [Sphingomonas sanguinis]
MRPDLWLAFVAATLVIGLIPGPGVAAILGYAIGSGRRTAFASVGGLMLGNLAASTASLLGMGAVLAASTFLFGLLKWAGAVYLIVVGAMGLWRARNAHAVAIRPRMISLRAAFLGNLGVGTFHPKTILFLAAFAPQFIYSSRPYWAQVPVLIATFVIVLALTDSCYAWAASSAGGLLRSPRAQAWAQRAGGGALIFAGLATAAIRQ